MLDLSHIKNLAITGANGFVGRSIIENISKLSDQHLPKKLTLITRNGLNYSIGPQLFERTRFIYQDLCQVWEFQDNVTHLVNLAADGTKDSYSNEACSKFTSISENLVQWIKRTNQQITVFHASSGACFGYKPLVPRIHQNNIKANFILNRIEVEDFLLMSSRKIGFNLSIGRLFTFSGSNILSKSQYALSQFIDTATRSRRIIVKGDPETERSYLHQDAMSGWIMKALSVAESDIFLQIGSNEVVTIGELANYIAQETGASIEFAKDPIPGDRYIPENSETMCRLGMGQGKSWRDAVLEMIKEARKTNYATD